MLELSSLKSSIPDCIFQEEVISDSEINRAKQLIEGMIHNAERFQVINPFSDLIQAKFTDDAGFRTRQLNILLANINLHTLANAKYRLRFEYNGTVSVISTITDVLEANKLTKKPTLIPPAKIQFFNKYVRAAILENGKDVTLIEGPVKCLTASQIADYITAKGIATDRKKLQENYLRSFVDYGYLEEFQDPASRNRNVYCLPGKYESAEAGLESTLVDDLESTFIDDIDEFGSCVKSFVDRIITRRLEKGNLADEYGTVITPEQLINIVLNRRVWPKNTHENKSSMLSTNVDGEYTHLPLPEANLGENHEL
jgi:hypothetical protein